MAKRRDQIFDDLVAFLNFLYVDRGLHLVDEEKSLTYDEAEAIAEEFLSATYDQEHGPEERG